MKHLNRLTLLVLAAFCLIGCEQTKLQMNVIGTWRVVESTDQTDVHKIWKFNADKTCIVNGWQQLSEVRGEQFEYAVFESEGQMCCNFSKEHTTTADRLWLLKTKCTE